MDILPQACITRDNVSVAVAGNIYTQFVNAEKAAYGNQNPLYAVRQFAQSAMRAAIGERELDEILHDRAALNRTITDALKSAALNWGLEIKRYEITQITPGREIAESMDKQAAAERSRRERVKTAEGERDAEQLAGEGTRLRVAAEAEGEKVRVEKEAEATRSRLALEAAGEACRVQQQQHGGGLPLIRVGLQTTAPTG